MDTSHIGAVLDNSIPYFFRIKSYSYPNLATMVCKLTYSTVVMLIGVFSFKLSRIRLNS
jgi:hypothetical protein